MLHGEQIPKKKERKDSATEGYIPVTLDLKRESLSTLHHMIDDCNYLLIDSGE